MKLKNDPEWRWENEIDHNPKTLEVMKYLKKLDRGNEYDHLLKSGGDGDPGETLMYLLDCYFEKAL